MTALLRAGGFSGAHVSKVASHTGVNFTTALAIVWDQENIDIGGWHESVTNPSRLTVPTGVTRVQLAGNINIANHTANKFGFAQIHKDGAGAIGLPHQWVQANTTSPSLSLFSGPLIVVAGAYFELKLTVETDTSIDILTGSSFSIWEVK